MVCVAEFTVPPDSFPFGTTLVELQDVEIEVDQIVPTDESALSFFWVSGCDPEEFVKHAEREPAVSDTRELERVGDTALFRAEWSPNEELIEGLTAIDVTIVESVGTADHWRFEVRTADRAVFDQFQQVFEDQGIPITLERLYELDQLVDGDEPGPTSDQRETFLVAYQEGYFDKPRGINQEELGERFGISRRAVAERLRRGPRNLVADALPPDEDRDRSNRPE